MIKIPAIENLIANPNGRAIFDTQHCSSWLELMGGALDVVDTLRAADVLPGQHIAVLLGNGREYYQILLGTVFAGCWLTPVNSHLTEPEIEYVLRDSGARMVFTDRALASTSGDMVTITPDALFAGAAQYDGDVIYQRLQGLLTESAGGFLMYTSGTTGRPKGVKRNSPALLGETLLNWCQLGCSIGLDGSGVHLVTGPVYHAAPGLYSLYDLLNGAGIVLMPRWDAERCLQLIESQHITHTHLVPTMFVRLLRDRENFDRAYDLSTLELVLHGAAPVAAVVKQQMIAWWGPVLVEYWGGSESGILTRVSAEQWLSHPGTVGKPLPQYELSVRDENFDCLPAGDIGTLYTRKPGQRRPFHYFNDEEKTESAYIDDWFTLGDLGWQDAQGYVYIADRRSNLIISGGVNIYPAEVESALLEHAAVADVVVIGVDDTEWGKRVHAVIQP
ncbi:MAG: AMP-binding protein, partial [Halioglobus sp.]